MTSDKSYTGWYFLAIVILGYIITFFISSEKMFSALTFFKNIIIKIIPIYITIFVFMVLTNYFIKPKTLVKYLGEKSGVKGWLITIFAGILSSGPIYMWYPLLFNLKKHGMRIALIATFLYNRAVKIPLLPLLIAYFGLSYTIILMSVMIIISIVQGWTTEKILEAIK